MELALGAMAGLAPKLGELLMQEYVVQKGLKPDIESLSRELVAMKAGLDDLSKIPPDQLTEMEKLSARQVRELSYDMEDAIDDFMRVADGGKSTTAPDANVFKKILAKATAATKVKHRHQISGKVKDIKKLSNELAELRTKYTVRGAGANLAASTGIDPRVLNLYKKESDLVGIEESRDKVIRMLSVGTGDDAHAFDQDLKIVSIVGVGRLGKTTLAKTVHDMLKKQFGCSTFISVGRTPNMTRIFEKLLVELDEKYKQVHMARWDAELLSNELHKFLQHKRYFIVIDDIWDVESWEVIRYALKDNNCGSRIIMTTRNFDVTTKVEEVYRLKPLSDENSKKLFYKRILSQEGESLDGVSGELSSKIINKCGGIPLAIIALASLLVDRPHEDWLKVYDSIGFGNGDNTLKILSYSYYDLPSYLKPCILYLSKFREDSILDTQCVIWMWIGEGFVHLDEKEKGSLFEVGERYFTELVNRSMIQPMDVTYKHEFRQYFRVHDIVFDLIRKLSDIEKFIIILDSTEQHASLDSKVRRLAVRNHHVQCFPEDTIDMPEVLRSLSIEDSKIKIMARPYNRFRVCRVLQLRNCHAFTNASINLKHLGRLLHLKYLDISFTVVGELPELEHLKSLQALVLIDTGLDELPPAVCSLKRLMCLEAKGFKKFPTDRMGNLTLLESLQLKTVVGRSATKGLVAELGRLTRLRVVTITFSEELDECLQNSLVQSLCNLQELQELLVLSSKGLRQDGATVWENWKAPLKLRRLLIQGIKFLHLPGWINRSCMPRLLFLSLHVHNVEVQDLDNLARLPELSYLDLVGFSWPPGYTVGRDGFKNLRFCHVNHAFKFLMGAMPRLEELQLGVFPGYWSWEKNGVLFEQFPTKDTIEDLDLGLDNLLSVEQVTIKVICIGATATEVQEVEAIVWPQVESHPNRPTIKMDRVCEENILSDESKVALLQHRIEQRFSVLQLKDKPDACFISHLRRYRHLQKAIISIDCAGASMREVEKVEAAFRHVGELHHNHPTIQLIRTNTNKIVSSSDHPNTEEVEAMVTRAVKNHPNRPTMKMSPESEKNMLSDKHRVALLQQTIRHRHRVLQLKDEPDAFFINYLQSYQHLKKAVISIDCTGTSVCEVETVEAIFRHAAEVHRNHPTIQLIRANTDKMFSSSDHTDIELDDDHDDSLELSSTALSYTDEVVSSDDSHTELDDHQHDSLNNLFYKKLRLDDKCHDLLQPGSTALVCSIDAHKRHARRKHRIDSARKPRPSTTRLAEKVRPNIEDPSASRVQVARADFSGDDDHDESLDDLLCKLQLEN